MAHTKNHVTAALEAQLAATRTEIKDCVDKASALDKDAKATSDKLGQLHEAEWQLLQAIESNKEIPDRKEKTHGK